MSKAPILCVGRSGQLAQCLVASAEIRGTPLLAIGRPQLDVSRLDSFDRIVADIEPGVIVNTAAYTAVDRAETEVAEAEAVNSLGAENVAKIAARDSVPLVSISTDYVFDGEKRTPYTVYDTATPLNIYGRTKLEGERRVLEVYSSSLILRTSWVYSAVGQNFLRTMLRFCDRDQIRVVDDQFGAPTYAMDLARGILDIIERKDTSAFAIGGIYHLTASGMTTWCDFARFIFDGWRKRGFKVPHVIAIKTSEYQSAARRPQNSLLDVERTYQAFGVQLPAWGGASLDHCLDCVQLELKESQQPR